MKDLKQFIKTTIREFLNENVQNYETVYRGQPNDIGDISPRNSIWVTYDYDFANEYGNVKEYKLPKKLNILDTDYYSEWESLVDEFDEDGDYDEYKYEPTDEFISFLNSKGYDGFMNGDNILIFDKSLIENISNISYSIDHAYGENILVNAKIDGVIIGTLSIIDETDYLSPEDESTFTILSVFVDKEYRKMGLYINLIKYFLSKNKYGVKVLSSEKNPEFDTEPRSVDADNFWKHIYTNQKKYGVYVEKYDDNYEISLK